ncbi:DUF6858 family protein [Thiothrix lacustris]|uniref:DUF6858 family protein n=1 Tax=Thiothrix lacustris TaxID=525917 RepID=UPI00048C4AA8|nr:hypothetical protein [Thiothrix lacustris]
MKQTMLMEKYPIYTLEIGKDEIAHKTMDAILDYFLAKIDAHPIAQRIALFDHYAHTKALGDKGEINPEILDARDVVFCFGQKLPTPQMLAIRPRSIGVAEMADKFVISFLETPMPHANEAMEAWVKGLVAV